MTRDFFNWQLAEAYVAGTLPALEQTALHTRLETDPVYAADFYECVNMIRNLEEGGRQKQFRNMLVNIHKEQSEQKQSSWKVRTIPLRTHYLRTGAVAAGIALLTSLSTFGIVNHNEKKRSSQYSVLRRELETIKRSQSALNKKINVQQNQPVAPANYAGTGFALTNDGYFVTNYHVTEGADSVYIQNKAGQYFKTHLVTFDAASDVAILKVDHKNFRFGKTDVPYAFAINKKKIGAKVFTLGFPQDEIVYNEGYISSKNGFQGDSIQYRLELPANPGQSGAPVMDNNGYVIGIVTGKETESEGTTYAVSTKAIYDLIENSDLNIKLSKGNNKLHKLPREQQVEKLEYFTCSVKVYKKP
ncbi:MAG TPA: S1C family serine protease [Flavipsychrobacter sp.]|jgi:S1-C subfamily serine protease|nr:S1C family serine protease [Flavipsychrobacter sp.]